MTLLVRFDTKSGTITMFGDVAKRLLKLMGQTGDVPGAVLAADIPGAVERLKSGLNAEPAQAPQQKRGEDGEPGVSLKHRALPLIELLERAAKRGDDVLWEQEGRKIV